MIKAEVLDALLAAGATAEMIVAAVKADLRQEEIKAQQKRAKDAARQQKSRRNRAMSRDVTVTDRDNCDIPPPNDNISNPPPVTPAANAADPLSDFSVSVVEEWNREIAGTPLPKARPLNADRRKHLRCRVAEHGQEAVLAAIRAMCRSDFHSGRSGKWLEGSLGWLLKSPENFQKMLERADKDEAVKPAAKPSVAGGSLFARLQSGEITQAEFEAERARLSRAGQPPPTQRERPQSGSIAKFLPNIAGSA